MASSFEALKDLMLRSYPDASDLTFIVSTERGKGFAQHFAHREVGGVLPSFKSYDEYKGRALSERLGLRMPDRREELVLLTLLLLERRPELREDAAFAAFNMLPAIRCACMFSVDRETMKNLKGIRPEQVDKIDELFDTMEAFNDFLEARGLFMPLLRERDFLEHAPGEREYFVNLPLFTPSTDSFFRKIPSERKLVDMPAFAKAFRASKPDYPSSLHLLSKAGVMGSVGSEANLSFHELQGRASLPAFIRKAVASFLEKRENDDRLYILLLEEGLAFYLWQTAFKDLGNLVNFSIGLPLAVSAAGARVQALIDSRGGKAAERDFSGLKAELAHELYSRRNVYVREDLYAIEAAIDFVGRLEKYCEPLGGAFRRTATLLLQQEQLFLKGERSAPVQVVGLGEATGAPFERGIVLPLNADAFPSRIYNGPFLNFVHTPQLRDSCFEVEDLALRQFMSFGKEIDVVSVFDEAKGMTPSFFFTFLKNEFSGSTLRSSLPTPVAKPSGGAPFVPNDGALREKILEHSFSFSSLSRFLTCPFSFYYANIEKLSVPDAMQDEENINLILGSFVHAFFNRLADEAEPQEAWRMLFDELWGQNEEIARIEGNGLFRLLLLSRLDALAQNEVEEERLLLFGSGKRATEKSLEAVFGSSVRLKLNGRLDAVVENGGFRTILDYKYKRRPPEGAGSLADSLGNANGVDPRLQIALYAYLLSEAEGAPLESLRGCFVYIKEDEPGKRFAPLDALEIQSVGATMRALSERMEQILSQDRLEPNYRSHNCMFCLLKSLCKAESFYRKSARRSA